MTWDEHMSHADSIEYYDYYYERFMKYVNGEAKYFGKNPEESAIGNLECSIMHKIQQIIERHC